MASRFFFARCVREVVPDISSVDVRVAFELYAFVYWEFYLYVYVYVYVDFYVSL